MRIAELPFAERPVLELLNLDDASRLEPDPDYAGFGHARIGRVELIGAGGRVVEDALLIAVHSADDGEPLHDDVELEFVLGEPYQGGSAPSPPEEPAGPPPPTTRPARRSVTALLSAFLDRWLPRLAGDARAIVLVMCNPHRAAVRAAAAVPIHYALGDVESWLDGGDVRLVAEAWRTA